MMLPIGLLLNMLLMGDNSFRSSSIYRGTWIQINCCLTVPSFCVLQDYYKTLEDADEKVQLANHIYDLVNHLIKILRKETLKLFDIQITFDGAL